MQKKIHYNKITKIVMGFYLIDQDAPIPHIIIDESQIPSYFEKLIVDTSTRVAAVTRR